MGAKYKYFVSLWKTCGKGLKICNGRIILQIGIPRLQLHPATQGCNFPSLMRPTFQSRLSGFVAEPKKTCEGGG